MSPKELTREEEQRIYAVNTYIVNHLNEHFTIKELARKAAVGEQKFKESFYNLFGMSAGKYIHATRMQTARSLLTHTDKTVKEISQICGYKRARNFSTAFKKFFGKKPHECR